MLSKASTSYIFLQAIKLEPLWTNQPTMQNLTLMAEYSLDFFLAKKSGQVSNSIQNTTFFPHKW